MSDFYEGKRILVTGGHGFLGHHLVRRLNERSALVVAPSRANLDLSDNLQVHEYIEETLFSFVYDGSSTRFDIVFHLAAHVGGIHYNIENPFSLVEDNSLMALNAVHLACAFGAKLVAAGSVCAYPKHAPVPTVEENLYEGYPEESNGAYGNSKRLLLEAQRAANKQFGMDTVHLVSANLYGPGDHFSSERSHVIPALIVKIQSAIENGDDEVVVWGTGRASRDFLYVGDAADAYLVAGEKIDSFYDPINIASNNETPIHYLVTKLCDIMGFEGKIVYDKDKPDGQPRRSFRTDAMKSLTGWEPATPLDVGLRKSVEWYRALEMKH